MGVMNPHPSYSTSARQVIGVILETTYAADVCQLLEPWSEKHGFVLERSRSDLGDVLTFYRGVNRRKFIRHEVRLGKLGSSLALVAESVSKGQPMDALTAEHMDILAPLAALKPKHVRNDIGPVEDGVGFIRKVRAHLADATTGLPFILISPPHDSPDRELIEAILAENDDVDVIRVGRKTKTKIRALGFEQFCQGHLLLRIPGHEAKVFPLAPSGAGLREAIRLARASHGLRLGKLIGTAAQVKAGAEPKPYQHSCWTVQAALLKAWSQHYAVMDLHQNAVDTAAACNYHDPEWVYDALSALCKLAQKWQAGESIGGNWEQTMKSHGYVFSPRSSSGTLGKCGRHYEFTHAGKHIVAEAHLGRGSQGARNVIRIYLHRDEERKVLVVCHVGSHLPTGNQTT
jgi:hypothetical protein